MKMMTLKNSAKFCTNLATREKYFSQISKIILRLVVTNKNLPDNLYMKNNRFLKCQFHATNLPAFHQSVQVTEHCNQIVQKSIDVPTDAHIKTINDGHGENGTNTGKKLYDICNSVAN